MANFKTFDVDSVLELPADHFTAEAIGAAEFKGRTPLQAISIKAGYKDGSNTPQNITQLVGVIDEFELNVSPTAITTTVRGRDNAALAIDRVFQKHYLRAPVSPTTTSQLPLPGNPLFVPFVQGQFTASQIAADVVKLSTGLSLSWKVPFDYTLLSDFSANGRVIDTLKRLVDPFLQVEPFRVDIFVKNTTVVIQQRQFPVVPEFVFQIRDARRSSLKLRARKAKKVGVLVLKGGRFPSTLTFTRNINGGVTIGQSNQSTSTVHEEFVEGTLVSRTIVTTTTGQPNGVMLSQVKEVFTADPFGPLTLTSRETTTNTYDTAILDVTGGKNQQILTAQTIISEGNDPDDPLNTWRTLSKEETGYSYDGNNALEATSTMTSTLDESTLQLTPTKLVKKDYDDIDSGLVQQTTTVFTFDTDTQKWIIQTRDIQIQGGKRPGGPRGNPAFPQVEIVKLLSNDPDAVFVEYSNENLTLAQLQILLAEFTAANAITWEYELMFEGVGMPWLQRGSTVQFQNIVLDDGSLFNTPPATITEVVTRYDESTPNASFVQRARAFAWAN